MFTSLVDVPSGIEISELGEEDECTWHQFHAKVWVAQYFELHGPMAMKNAIGRSVPFTWLLLDSQLTVDLIGSVTYLPTGLSGTNQQ